MAAKQTQATRRQTSHQVRSVMLTRFKLSQQKRQLREKERRTSQSVPPKALSPAPKSPGEKKRAPGNTKSSPRSRKERNQGRDSEEPQTKKPQRRGAKKIVLKPRHELKVIGRSGGCKRKLNLPQKGMKSPPAKRLRSTGFHSALAASDRSQSPVYSELGFEEVIRMVDENQSLDDEDLLEILTCPSPVWWEDPPDGDYTEGPIIMTSKVTSLPTIAKQLRSKSARKKTPRKIILEPVECTDNDKQEAKEDTETVINAGTFDNIKKADVRFKNKRSKLESLLSTIKDKLNVSNRCDSKGVKENRTDNKELAELKSTNHKGKSNSRKEADIEGNDDISFVDISQQDKDCLRHLENIEIPIEGAREEVTKRTDGMLEAGTQNERKNPINLGGHSQLLKASKNLPKFHTNRRVKILNISKVVNGTQKRLEEGKSVSAKSILNEKRKSTEKSLAKRDTKLVSRLAETNSDTNQPSPHENPTESVANCKNDIQNPSSIEKHNFRSKYTNEETEIYGSVHKANFHSKESPKTEDFVTIFKIVNNATDTKNDKTRILAEEKEEIKEEPAPESDLSDREAKTLDSYYKKCKSRKRESNKSNNAVAEDAEVRDPKQRGEDIKNVEEGKDLCDSCDKDSKLSIIVPSTTDVRYCLKCSSIFDLEECDYCKRKEREKHKVLEHSPESNSGVRIINIQNSVNRHYV